MRLRLPSVCQVGCVLCGGADALDTEALEASLEHAERISQRRIYLQGTNLDSPPIPA